MVIHRKLLGNRRRNLVFILIIFLFITCVWRLHYVTSRASNEPDLEHFRRNRTLSHYLDNIQLLAEPTLTPCKSLGDIPLLVLVTSAPTHYEHRNAIRSTWAPHFPTYFVLGQGTQGVDVESVNLEASQYNDLIVYDFQDHYQNLTLKTALMLRWTESRCPTVGFLMKTDDDVLVNPWIMSKVVKEKVNAKLLGFKHYSSRLFRDESHKWYIPRWLYMRDYVPEYLSGPAYLMNGKYIKSILDAAEEVPLINLEDIYFTYLVARVRLGLELTQDSRLSPCTHWFLLPCVYWPFAINHELSPHNMRRLWPGLLDIAAGYDENVEVCSFYNKVMTYF